jgi:hypothetical protein
MKVFRAAYVPFVITTVDCTREGYADGAELARSRISLNGSWKIESR